MAIKLPDQAAFNENGDDVAEPQPEDSMQSDIDWLGTAIFLANNKKTILKIVAGFAVASLLLAFSIPVSYTAETGILPPQQTQSIATSLLGQFAPLASLTGKELGLKNPSDVYVALLRSRTIADALIQRFDLQKAYRNDRLSETREQLADRSRVAVRKDGLISVAVDDEDPIRATQIANAYTEELYKLNQKLAIGEASQRRLFFFNELQAAKESLAAAENELKKTQESTGLILVEGQAKAIIDTVARLRAQIAVKEVQLQSMGLSATDQNPDYLRAQQELNALRKQLNKSQDRADMAKGDILVPTSNVPAAGLEYYRKLREVKYHETVFELLGKQYEIAKIDEAKTAPVIQVVDVAVVPEMRTRPKRKLVLALGMSCGLFFACAWIILLERFKTLPEYAGRREKLRILRDRLFSRL